MKIKEFFVMIAKAVWRFLSHDKTPLGITLLITVGAVLGTYFLTPEINRALQKDNARAEHILKTIDQINEDMISLSENIRRYNFSVQDKHDSSLRSKRDAVYDKIAAMQWRLIDVAVISSSIPERNHLKQFTEGLTLLQFAVDDSYHTKKVISKDVLKKMSLAGSDVLDDLYKRAGVYSPES